MVTRRAYISGALFSAPDLPAARRLYESLAKVCEGSGFRAYVPHMSTDPETHAHADAQTVFRCDLEMLSAADVVVAVVNHASSGMGAELGIAFARRIPIVALKADSVRISRFLLGMLEAHRATLVEYSDELEATGLLRHALERHL